MSGATPLATDHLASTVGVRLGAVIGIERVEIGVLRVALAAVGPEFHEIFQLRAGGLGSMEFRLEISFIFFDLDDLGVHICQPVLVHGHDILMVLALTLRLEVVYFDGFFEQVG